MVNQNLRLTRRLGAGGMGAVWVARHLGLNSDVVVKFMAPELATHAESVARFRREAAAASDVRSPHVVQMIDFGVSPAGQPFIAMELLEGEDLAARLLRSRTLSPGEVAGVINQVARALTRAHERKIVHRDIKPENLFLCETGEDEAFVKVLDFGIAKVESADGLGGTATGAMIGTAYYMSPEQVLGSKTIDHRTDLWSLGVVAFQALTGVRPFEGETLGAVSVAICHAPMPRPSSLNSSLPPAIDEWFATACAREPSARFANARLMADVLVRAVGGASVARVLSRQALGEEPTVVAASPIAARPEPPRLPTPGPQAIAFLPDTRQSLGSATTNGASVRLATAEPETAAPRRRALPAIVLGAALLVGLVAGGLGFVASRRGGPAATVNEANALASQRPAASSGDANGAKGMPHAEASSPEPISAPGDAQTSPARSAGLPASPRNSAWPGASGRTLPAPAVNPGASPAATTRTNPATMPTKPAGPVKPKAKTDDEAIE